MKAFFDTNVLVAAVTDDTDRSDDAVDLLNDVEEGYTSILNVMELRSVLAKKKGFERSRIDRIEDRIARKTTVTFPTLRTSSRRIGSRSNRSSTRWTH